MLAEKSTPAAHVGEDQTSRQLDARAAHWDNVAVQLVLAARVLANDWLQEEHDDVRACVNPEHHKAVRAFFEAIKNADRSGLSDACEILAAFDQQVEETAPARDPRVPDMFEIGGAA